MKKENTYKKKKVVLIHRMKGKINTYQECLVENPDGRREYLTGAEWDELDLKQSKRG